MHSNRQYILEQLALFNKRQYRLSFFKDKQELLKMILDETSFLDNNSSLAERLYCIKNRIVERKMCPVCKIKPLNFSCSKMKYYETGCSPSCSKKNKLVQDKVKQTCIKKYGFMSHNSSPEVKQKKIEAYIQKYGVTNPSYVDDVKEKRKQTSLEHFGVGCVLSLRNVRDKRQMVSLTDSYKNFILKNKYDEPLFTLDEYLKRKDEHEKLKFKCKKCGNEFETWHHDGFHSRCPMCYPKTISNLERELQTFISQFACITTNNKEIIKPLELDIYCENSKLAFEFDGLYWHSYEFGKNKNYHLHKTEECEKKGIQLIHVFENEWLQKQDIVKSRIKNLFGIYDKTVFARKCEVREIGSKTSRQFQEDNHIQGSVNSKVNLGLYYENELISLMTFGKCRFDKKHEWEMLRFCNKLGYHIPGAASRLLKHFERDYRPKSLVSYADRRWSQGKVYEVLGFKLDHISKPDYWYFNDNYVFESRIKFQKHKLSKLLNIYDKNLSEYDNMKANGYRRIYDCGNYVFEKIYTCKV